MLNAHTLQLISHGTGEHTTPWHGDLLWESLGGQVTASAARMQTQVLLLESLSTYHTC